MLCCQIQLDVSVRVSLVFQFSAQFMFYVNAGLVLLAMRSYNIICDIFILILISIPSYTLGKFYLTAV